MVKPLLVIAATFVLCVIPASYTQRPTSKGYISQLCERSDDLLPCREAFRGSGCHCAFNKAEDKARCCHVDLRRMHNEITTCLGRSGSLRALFLSNCTADHDILDFKALSQWLPDATTLSLQSGHYTGIKNVDPKDGIFPSLMCLNISSNALTESGEVAQLINAIGSLRVVDLSLNQFTFAPELNNRTTDLWMNIADNPDLKCDGIREAIQRKAPTTFLNKDRTWCTSQNSFEWFNSTDPISLQQIETREQMNQDCPTRCRCETGRLMYASGQRFYTVNVDCSGLNLTEMPRKLPRQTYNLNISMNNITSLEPLIRSGGHYENVRVLDAQNNHISSIQILEGSQFLQQVEVINLRHNRLQKLPTPVLKQLVERNWNNLHVSLGENYFFCDCSTYHVLRSLLIKYDKTITDNDEIYCNDTGVQVLQLKNTDVCLAEEDWISYIYYVIAVEVTLLVLLIGKVSYDYWVFKNAGYLPWPASKMPKLPCDCVLET